jgi:hypothetical protein
MRPLRVGDLVCLHEPRPEKWREKHHGAGIITRIDLFAEDGKHPHITVKWLKSDESFKFLTQDLKVLHEA